MLRKLLIVALLGVLTQLVQAQLDCIPLEDPDCDVIEPSLLIRNAPSVSRREECPPGQKFDPEVGYCVPF